MASNGKGGGRSNPLGLIDESTAARTWLNVCERTLQRERQKGRIEFYRVGIRVYYTEEQIRSYLQRYGASVVLTRSAQAAA